MAAETLKRVHKWLFWVWIMPGIPISVYLKDSLAWIVFMSAYTIVMEHYLGWRHEDRADKADKADEPKDEGGQSADSR